MAAVLRLQPEEVAPRREAALDRIAMQVGIHDQAERARLPEVLAGLPADQWPDEGGGFVSAPPEPPPPPPPTPAAPKPSTRRRRPRAAILVVIAGALLGGVAGLLLFGGDADDDGKSDKPAATAETPAAPASKPVELEPVLSDFPARGTARIEGSGEDSRLIMSLSGLPPREEAYAVWLYNSVTDAVLIDRVVGTSLEVDEVLPADPADYRFIDVSQEPIDDNPNHSGASVMRIPVDELLKGAG
ncbi:MAG: anti-sigma factor [Thermoleophilaceae bacterium]|nr:anti-sigma factor [Thermoleophilaceae bacterium]